MFLSELELDIRHNIKDNTREVRFFDERHYFIASIKIKEKLICYGARCDKLAPYTDIKSALIFISKMYDFNTNTFHLDII